MKKNYELLDCTLRDGAYIVNSQFGESAIRGIIKKLQDAKVEIIECGWLKDSPHVEGTSFYHMPKDLQQYLFEKKSNAVYTVMIDWDRYQADLLPENDGLSIDAIRIVFPHGKHREGIKVGEIIKRKGYRVFFQAANTLAYTDQELVELAHDMNAAGPESLSLVDTFGAMYEEDLERIANILDRELEGEIKLGFHSHNNQQLSFALTMHFVKMFQNRDRQIIVDASLNGMGRGAGNAATELLANYLNGKYHGNYDMNAIMDAIDTYMQGFHEKYVWGYSTPYFIAGIYQCHVNNIAYLLKNHRTSSRDMRNIIESLSPEERRHYDYDLLENRYIENQNRMIDDSAALEKLKNALKNKKVLLLAPGKSLDSQEEKIKSFIRRENPVVIAVNAVHPRYQYEYAFFTNMVRYEYAKVAYLNQFREVKKILLSNIKTDGEEDELIINFNLVIKRGWEHFDNAVILCLRMMNRLGSRQVYLAGFDGFRTAYNESYFDVNLPTLNPDNKWDELNQEIRDMFLDFRRATEQTMQVIFLTESMYE